MPAEWEKHSATWLAWPNDDDYFGDKIKNIENIYLKIVKNLHEGEMVKILVLDQKEEDRIKIIMGTSGFDLSKIVFYYAKYTDVWIRDYGPMFVKEGSEKNWVKWKYDGYGGKFPELLGDNDVFTELKHSINFKMHSADFVLEGGAIDSNGGGIILTTEECLIENRNKGKSKQENNEFLEKYIGAEKIIWLKKGLLNDHTDGHIDEVARFVSKNKILCSFEDDENNENYARLSENYNFLKEATDQDGNKFEVVKLPVPHMHYEEGDKDHHGKQAPVSYANFYVGNKVVLVSTFNDPNDEKAISILEKCFPDRKIIGIDARDLIYGGGAIHCITQQEPE